MSQTVYINGIKNDCLKLNNRAIHYGDGLFETILIKNGLPTLLDLHLKRLVQDSEKLHIKGVKRSDFKKILLDIAKKNSNSILKLIIARVQQNRGYAIQANHQFDSIITVNSITIKKNPLTAKICTTTLAKQPLLAKIKHLNRLEQVLASDELEQGVDEGLLFLHEKDQLVETISSNIFIISNGKIFTPILKDAGVEGIAKKIILSTAKENGILIEEKNISKSELMEADCVFISNSVFGLRLLKQINDTQFAHSHSLFNTLNQLTKSYFIE